MGIAVYPGSFDPPTNGHLDIIRRAACVFKPLVIAVADNMQKDSLFNIEERYDLVKMMIKDEKIKNVEIDQFSGLLSQYMAKKEARIIIRGLRAVSDFEYEFSFTAMNKSLNDQLETVYFMSNTSLSFLSSRLVKEVVGLGGDAKKHVPSSIYPILVQRISQKFSS